MADRVCALRGCGVALDGMRAQARYCCGAHRTAGWKGSHPAVPQNGRERFLRRSGPSGLQVSYPKAVHRVAQYLAIYDDCVYADSEYEEDAARILAEALSPAQRARLEGRS